jgi:predicted nucleotidyltransferase
VIEFAAVRRGCEHDTVTALGERPTPRDVLREQRSTILSVLLERGGRDVRVFGSIARGDDDELSDVDLLVELPHGESPADELLTVLGLSEELSELIGTRIEVVTPRTLRAEVRAAALAEAVAL